jgi:hypothetical protein
MADGVNDGMAGTADNQGEFLATLVPPAPAGSIAQVDGTTGADATSPKPPNIITQLSASAAAPSSPAPPMKAVCTKSLKKEAQKTGIDSFENFKLAMENGASVDFTKPETIFHLVMKDGEPKSRRSKLDLAFDKLEQARKGKASELLSKANMSGWLPIHHLCCTAFGGLEDVEWVIGKCGEEILDHAIAGTKDVPICLVAKSGLNLDLLDAMWDLTSKATTRAHVVATLVSLVGLAEERLDASYAIDAIERLLSKTPDLLRICGAKGTQAIHHVADKDVLCKMVDTQDGQGDDDVWLERSDLSVADEKGKLPIHHAAENNRLAVARQMLQTDPSLLERQDDDGKTPFLHACSSGWQDMASFLQDECKANDKAKTTGGQVSGSPPLYRYVQQRSQLEDRALGRQRRNWSRRNWSRSMSWIASCARGLNPRRSGLTASCPSNALR